MVFSSNIFLFLFLPVFLGVYYLTPFRWKSLVILVGSYIFYAWWRVDFLLLFAGVTLVTHMIALRVESSARALSARRWMQLGVVLNLLTLGLFKYFNFGIDSLNAVLEQSGLNTVEALRFILPIGISFHIFQCISFLIDVYRNDAPPAPRFLDFAAFTSLFPQLIAGPVLRYKDLAGQFTQRTHSFDLFSRGAYRFMGGFAKKVLIADTLAPTVDQIFALENPTMAESWLGAVAYALQLYFDFSGYSDMAIGLGLMMGFRFMENFDQPYISRSITEFWRRWHISLSLWLKDYLYIPLGGNRHGRARTYINLMLTMVLGGFWHGANWTFLLWGAWHGMWLALEKAGLRTGAMIGTGVIVLVGWVMFRAESVAHALDFYAGMIGVNGFAMTDRMTWQLGGLTMSTLVAGLGIIWLGPWVERRIGLRARDMAALPLAQVMAVLLFILAVMKLSYQSYSPFLYFQF